MRYKPNDRVILEMLVGNDWRVIKGSYREAVRLLKKTNHRGYLIYGEFEHWSRAP